MKLDCQLVVNAPKENVWAVITDYEHMVENISAITHVEIHERPTKENENNDAGGGGRNILGLKWTETRTMFGQEATETMWVTKCIVNDHYETRAESHGAVYISKMYVKDHESKEQEQEQQENENNSNANDKTPTQTCIVGMSFDGEAQSFCSKIMMSVMGWMFVDATKKALMQDLQDIKARAESMP